ncbi:hypothetical protein MPC38_14300 [Prescottella equi]|uniref:hypothetical protein n=1 Tax=Rhodococcus hoagii TaxID=43767 RepID=UPI001C7418AE|nr:hypothetical protein [Prescottella equi]UNQ37931.1 hypothetical protein MPC38_14300 [Prescottella equi]BCN49491.1 hypothetical protein RE9416_27920 [Prescottella equi]
MVGTLVVVTGDVDSAGAVVVVTGACDVVVVGALVVVVGAIGAELCPVVEGELSAVRVGAEVVDVSLGFAEAIGAMENEDKTRVRTAKIIPSAAHRDTTSPPARRRNTRLRMKDTSRSTLRFAARLTRGRRPTTETGQTPHIHEVMTRKVTQKLVHTGDGVTGASAQS